jgi:aldehyde:ferredoxin oxidoreductase
MGSKNIKAIVFTGKSKKKLADPSITKDFSKKLAAKSKDDPGVLAYKTMGLLIL